MSDDSWGCIVAAIALVAGGKWVYDHYEIRSKALQPNKNTADALLREPRPTGLQQITEAKTGAVWKLDADSVRGDRRHRQGWMIIDASKDKTIRNWRTGKSLFLVDCETTAIRELSQMYYNAKGEPLGESVGEDPKDVRPEYYPEGTIGFAPVAGMCRPAYDAPKID